MENVNIQMVKIKKLVVDSIDITTNMTQKIQDIHPFLQQVEKELLENRAN